VYKSKTFLAVILARGGSKRLPHKNTMMLRDKPLIAWSIEAGLNSKYIDEVVLSSDDAKILDIALEYDAKTIHRPAHLASDESSSFDAVEHLMQNYKTYDYIVLLQPTSPLRTSKHINEAIELLLEKKADAIVSVCENEHSPLWSNTLPKDDSLEGFIREEVKGKRSQDLPKYFQLNGAIYICDAKRLLEEKSFFLKDNIFAYKMQREDSIDIDEELDFKLAELLLNS